MHARTIRVQGPPEAIERSIELVKSQAIPALNEFPGFKGAYWLGDRSSGKGFGVFFYESAQHLEESRDRGAALRDAILQQTGGQVTEVKEFEVIADTGQKIHTGATHARLTTVQGDPSRREETIRQVTDVIVPNAKKMDGFLGGVWLRELSDGPSHGLTLWDGQGSIEASRPQADQLRSQSTANVGSSILGVEEFEILARAETPVAAAS